MGNALTQESVIIIAEESLLRDYKNASVQDYLVAKNNFDTLQATVGDKMTVTLEEFDDIFSLICHDPTEHFELFDSWELGKVDVLEVFAVVIVYCKATMDVKIPLLFDLFDFDHSRHMSEHELVLLMLCATRGLCKAVGLDRPSTSDLEELAQHAFVSIDCNHDGQLSLQEFTDWVKREPHLLQYLKRFVSSRLLYDSQTDFETLFTQLSESFEKFAVNLSVPVDGLPLSSPKLVCSLSACRAIIQQHCPATSDSEADYLVATMQATMDALPTDHDDADPITPTASKENSWCSDDEADRVLPDLITLPVFRVILAPYVAFIAADNDKQHVIDIRELKVLLWLLRGQEPTSSLVQQFMSSLDSDHDVVLSAVEWVSYAIQHEAVVVPVLPSRRS